MKYTTFCGENSEDYRMFCKCSEGTDRLFRKVGHLSTNVRCVTSQKSQKLIYIAAGA